MTGVTAVPTNNVAGAGTIYTVSFTVQNALPANGKIVLSFPPGFDVSGVEVAYSNDVDGGFRVNVNAQAVTVTRDGTGTSVGATNGNVSIKIGPVVNHATAGSSYNLDVATQDNAGTPIDTGTSASFNLVPGKPSGTVTLMAKPRALPINAGTGSRITSAVIRDANNNAVGANKLFTVSVNNSAFGSIDTSDADPNVSGFQVPTHGSGILSFPFKAGSTGGLATVFVSSVDGSASGSVNISVNELRVLAIQTSLDSVSQAQDKIPVTMTVQNIGADTITVTDAGLTFKRSGSEVSGQFEVTKPSFPLKVPGNSSIRTLAFSVKVKSSAALGVVIIDGNIAGALPGGAAVSTPAADVTDSWTVQRQPNIAYVSGSLNPGQVSIGTFYEFGVRLRNDNSGQPVATVELNPDSTTFQFKDSAGRAFAAKLDADQGAKIPGNAAAKLTFRRGQIPVNMLSGSYSSQVTLIGTQNGVRFAQILSTAPNNVVVGQAPPLQIVEIRSSQDAVTQGMSKLWTIEIEVRNNTSSAVELVDAGLNLVKAGSGTDTAYHFIKPDKFSSGNLRIDPSASDNLIFQIDKSGQQTGIMAVFAEVSVKDLNTNEIITAASNGTQKSILAETPARLKVALRASQPTVTQGQTQPWNITMTVTNSGESAAEIMLEDVSGRITRTSLHSDKRYSMSSPSGPIVVTGKDSTNLVFSVTQTASKAERIIIHGQVYAREINSEALLFDNTADGDSAVITVQASARISIGSAWLAQVFNFDPFNNAILVNANQAFQLNVKIKKTGEEHVDSIWVSLSGGDGLAAIQKNAIALTDTSQIAAFHVTAGSSPGEFALIAKIDSARSANTRAYSVKIVAPSSKTEKIKIQNPAVLSVGTVATSKNKVRFGQTQPWYISVPVKNDGEAPLVILPDSSRVTVKVGDVLQNDYVIADSTKNFGMTIGPGSQDLLIYKVTKTGTAGGTATLTATVKGRDKNSNEMLSGSQSASFYVETTALVRITKTSFPASVNRATGTDIALVNTGQNFPVEVTVENTSGLEAVDTVWVTLTGKKGVWNFTQQAKTRRRIGTQFDTAKVSFTVKAPSTPDSVGLKLTARIDSAKTLAAEASIGPALDDTALVRIERPAQLLLSVFTDDADNSLSTKQQFKIRALVSNGIGRAQTSNGGRLKIEVPEGYTRNDEDEKRFEVGVVQEWNVQAPSRKSLLDTLVVKMTQRPLDRNSGLPANTANTVATVVVNTFVSGLNIDSTFVLSPEGAKDRVVSTDQVFTIAARIIVSNNLFGKTATLRLPPGFGYAFRSDSTKAITTETVSWEIQAPSQEHLTPAKFALEVSALDGQTKVVERDTLVIARAERRAILQLQPGIGAPAGAQGGILSTGQPFVIVATLRNTGRATTYDTAAVRLDVTGTGITISEPLEKKIFIEPGAYSGRAEWQAIAPDSPTSQRALTFIMTRRPFDVNTNKPVLTSNDPAQLNVTTIDRGSISGSNFRISEPDGAKDNVLSTGQDFTVTISMAWANAINVTARLLLPPGFTTENAIKNLIGVGGTGNAEPSWQVRAPGQPMADAELRVLVRGNDAHHDTLSLADTSDVVKVSVAQRADLALQASITQPASAIDGVISLGQPFEVTATILNLGAANVYDTAKVRLDLTGAPGYTLVDPQEPLTKAAVGDAFKWWVRARWTLSNENDIVRFTLVARPRDENTNEPATSSVSRTELPVRAEGKRLLVKTLPRGSGPPALRGERALPLLRLELSNPAGVGSSNLVLKKMSFVVRNRKNQDVAPNKALRAVRIVDDLRRERVYGRVEVMPENNPVEVVLVDSVVVSPAKADTIVVLVDIAAEATAENFYLAFDRSQDFMAVDQDSGGIVTVEDERGKRDQDFQIDSDLTVLFASDPQEAFNNYPNPFRPGPNRNDGTAFIYNLPEASDGELKIYTLLGELVWETSFSANSRAGRAGFHKGELAWDGFNSAGKKVLNGVYVAILTTKFGKFTTKVAVVK